MCSKICSLLVISGPHGTSLGSTHSLLWCSSLLKNLTNRSSSITLSFQGPVCLLVLHSICYRVWSHGCDAPSPLVYHEVHLFEFEVSF